MIKIDENYTDYRDDTDPKYPAGKAVNASTEEGVDGTPILASLINDINGFTVTNKLRGHNFMSLYNKCYSTFVKARG